MSRIIVFCVTGKQYVLVQFIHTAARESLNNQNVKNQWIVSLIWHLLFSETARTGGEKCIRQS